jgi:DNA polymerase III alpha subunit
LEVNNIPECTVYQPDELSTIEFDKINQQFWYIPVEYQNYDIATFVLDQCKTEEELQRAGIELLMFQEREMFPLLRYLKYLVDTMRKHNVMWGVGRGSSVSSYVLYLMGVHRINSLFYDLSIDEFLK